jgi:hypothetical protein
MLFAAPAHSRFWHFSDIASYGGMSAADDRSGQASHDFAGVKKKRQAQVEMFGCEPDIGGAVQRRADAPLKPAMPREPCDVGLFGDDANQTE